MCKYLCVGVCFGEVEPSVAGTAPARYSSRTTPTATNVESARAAVLWLWLPRLLLWGRVVAVRGWGRLWCILCVFICMCVCLCVCVGRCGCGCNICVWVWVFCGVEGSHILRSRFLLLPHHPHC